MGAADPASTLRALASRDEEAKPIRIADEELRLMRDAFVAIDRQMQQELGQMVGRVIAVDVQQWEKSKRATASGRPAIAYLPASIEDRKDGWSKAAGGTHGLSWIHPRYEDVLRQHGRRRPGSTDPRPLGARTFFGLLGAEIAPRLVEPTNIETRHGDPAARIDRRILGVSQIDGLGGLARHATHLKGDRFSPDLLAVLKDIQRERGLRARRERARALISTFQREWDRMYSAHTEAIAVWSDFRWAVAGTIPASWLAQAMDEPWLTSEDGKRKTPRELAVRPPATEAFLGDDRSSFAYELDATDAASTVTRALGIQTDPQVSEIIDQLALQRDDGEQVDERAVMLCYAAIAANCKQREPTPDDMVGDLSMRSVRARFGLQPNRPGLLYANGRWLPPAKVFLGAPIFGRLRPFVPERTAAERLWRAIRLVKPSVTDCIDVLTEIAQGGQDDYDEQVLVDTYIYLEQSLSDASGRELTRLQNLPLWNHREWQTDRPIYVVPDDVAQVLSSRIRVWKLPLAPNAVSRLVVATGATLLTEDDFEPIVHEQAFILGASLEGQFVAAVELMRDWLARHDPKLFGALSISWEDLARARIAIDPELRIELRRLRRSPVSAPARAHRTRTPLTFYFADSEAPGEWEAGGRVIASLLTDGDVDKLALAWTTSWVQASKGARGTVTLVQDRGDDTALDSLFEQAKGAPPVPKRAAGPKEQGSSARGGTVVAPALPARRLKRIEDLSGKVAALVGDRDGASAKKERRRGLRDEVSGGREIGASWPAQRTAPLAYSDKEKEALALEILQEAINGDAAKLRDYRHLRGIGADALDKLRRYFELKAYYGRLPDEISLSANEAERAFRERDNFLLAVVAGLEEGYETVVKIFPDPLRILEFKPSTSVTLAGITRRGSALEVRFPDG